MADGKFLGLLSSRFRPGRLFKDYDLHEVAQLSTEVEELDAVTLNYSLSKFVMEVAKKSGERYPPRTVYGLIICNIQHMSGGKEGVRGKTLRFSQDVNHVNSKCRSDVPNNS